METMLLLIALAVMAPFQCLALFEEVFHSPTLQLALSVLFVCVYHALATFWNQKAIEERVLKSCQEQATPHRAELEALQAEVFSKEKTIKSLEYEKRHHATRLSDMAARTGEKDHQARLLMQRLRQAESQTHDHATVEAARTIKAEWNYVKGVMTEAGIDTDTHRGGWTGAIEELCQPKTHALSAAEENNAAMSSALDKERKELAFEKAAKDAAEKEVASLKTQLGDQKSRARILEIDNEEIKAGIDTEKRRKTYHDEELSRSETAKNQAATRSEVDKQLAKKRDSMISDMNQRYEREYARLHRKYEETLQRHNSELESAFDQKLNERVAAETAAVKTSSKKPKNPKGTKELKKAVKDAKAANLKATAQLNSTQDEIAGLNKKLLDAEKGAKEKDAISEASSKRSEKQEKDLKETRESLVEARRTIDEKDNEISGLNQSRIDKVAKATEMAAADSEALTKLARDLEETKTANTQTDTRLAEARRTIDEKDIEISGLKQKFEEVEAKATEMTAALSQASTELQDKLEEAHATMNQDKESLNTAKGKIDEIEANNTFLQQQQSDLVNALHTTTQDKEKLQEQATAAQANATSLQHVIDARDFQIWSLREQIDSRFQQQEYDGNNSLGEEQDLTMLDSGEALPETNGFDQQQESAGEAKEEFEDWEKKTFGGPLSEEEIAALINDLPADYYEGGANEEPDFQFDET